MTTSTSDKREPDREAVPFDDCLRLLINTPPKPKKAEDKSPPDEEEKESEK